MCDCALVHVREHVHLRVHVRMPVHVHVHMHVQTGALAALGIYLSFWATQPANDHQA
jgi:hypothetical protein